MRNWSHAAYPAAVFAITANINVPLPLFDLYRQRLGVGPDALALLYSIYAAATVVALPFLGALSDRGGRRRMVAAGLALGAAGSLLIAFAADFGALLTGRVLQGLSVAAASSSAIAAMAELTPGDGRGAARDATLAFTLGALLGPLACALLAETGLWPQGAGPCLQAVLMLGLVPAVLRAPEPARPAGGGAGTPGGARRGPRAMRAMPAAFWIACAAMSVSCAVQVVVFGMGGPAVALLLPQRPFLGAAGAMVFFMFASAVVQGVCRGASPAAGMLLGLPLALGGLVLLAQGLVGPLPEAWRYPMVLAAVAVGGAGHGLVAGGSLARVNAAAPAAHRGLATSLYAVARYLGVGLPVLCVGFAAARFGTAVALQGFAVAVAAASLAIAATMLPWRRGRAGAALRSDSSLP